MSKEDVEFTRTRIRWIGKRAISKKHVTAIYENGCNVVALCVEHGIEDAELIASGSGDLNTPDVPMIILEVAGDPSKLVEIIWPEYKGWSVYCSEQKKDYAMVCLTRNKEVDCNLAVYGIVAGEAVGPT